ncbi:uncharacterized protein TNCV_505981 [Trichonephila clavipes]|nr:uncharacterized protein TNCV_505981 [Trichonephila clavipes]
MDNIEYNFLKEQVIEDLLHYQEVIEFHSSMPIELPNNVLSRVLSAYQKFVEETRQGEHDVSVDLQTNRIKIDGKQIADFIEIFEKNINQFDESIDKNSLYIATAKPVPENVANFLLNIEKNGEDLRKQFIIYYAKDQDRFDKPIKKNQVLNFAGAPKKKKRTLGNKVIELRMQ